ncbi:MAG: hypothetical protein HY706_10715 [Candidatus Hydrogenedentes bacterium]|nr:hypothetical protein [Candidatus Hydrogenedentota bacterium]
MIPLELPHALILYSSLLGVLILGIWIYTEIAVHRYQRVLGKQDLWRCIFCGYSYLDEEAETLSQCPRCHNFNSVEDKNARAIPLDSARTEPEPEPAHELRRNPSHRKRPHQRRRGPRKR